MSFDAETRRRILESVDRLVRERVAPRAAEIDRDDEFPWDLWREAAKLGLFGIGIPPEYGGSGRDVVTAILISERIARVSAAFALSFNNTTDAAVLLVMAATRPVKDEWLPRIASGEVVPCLSITEPHGGSDVAAIRTRAERRGDGYVINGRKAWCTNAPVGGVLTIFAKTDPEAGNKGISAFVVPADTPGLSVGAPERLIGLHGSPTAEVLLEDVRIPAHNRLGEEGEGFRISMLTLDESRLQCAATAIGVATGALEHALDYARQRVQFGRPIIEHQGLEFLLADMSAGLAAARALWEEAIRLFQREHTRRASNYAGMAKLVCSDLCMRLTTDAVQVLGGNGLSRSYPVERFMRDAKAFQIYDGTSQIQKLMIGRQLRRGGLGFAPPDPDDLAPIAGT